MRERRCTSRHLAAGLPSLKRDGDPDPPAVHRSEPTEPPIGEKGPSEQQEGAPKLLQLNTLLQVATE